MKTRVEILPEIERQVFRTITDADWARELRAARSRLNATRERIAAAAKKFGTVEQSKKIT